MASSGRRSSSPHLPPEQYWTMSRASPPTDQPKVSIMPSTQALSTWSRAGVLGSWSSRASTAASTEKTTPTRSARVRHWSTTGGAERSAGRVRA